MNWLYVINSIGLILDLIGVLLLFKYGMPSDVNPMGASFLVTGENEQGKKDWLRHKFRSSLGILFVFIGFVLQLISSFMQIHPK